MSTSPKHPRFIFQGTRLPGVLVVEQFVHRDPRGEFRKMFSTNDLALFWPWQLCQVNLSSSKQRGTLRGIHFQNTPGAEAKLVTCLRGKVWDVVVDLRNGSPTFLEWFSVELKSEVPHSLLIPPGFGHGFQTLTDDVELMYLHSAEFDESLSNGVNPLDILLGIDWPLPITEISESDKHRRVISGCFEGIKL